MGWVFFFWWAESRGGGALTKKGGMGMCRGHDPLFFQVSRHSLAYQFTINAPLTPICNFRKMHICGIFSLVFGQNFSFKTQTFRAFLNFRSQDPSLCKEIILPRPYFWKPAQHIPTQKSWVPPSPGAERGVTYSFCLMSWKEGHQVFVFIFCLFFVSFSKALCA